MNLMTVSHTLIQSRFEKSANRIEELTSYSSVWNSGKSVYIEVESAQIIKIEFSHIIMATGSCNYFDQFIGCRKSYIAKARSAQPFSTGKQLQ